MVLLWLGIGSTSPVIGAEQGPVVLVEAEGVVETAASSGVSWNPLKSSQVLSPGVLIRTGKRSRAVVRLSDQSLLRIGEETIIEVPAPRNGVLRFLKGVLYYFHRDKPGVMPMKVPSGYAVVLGTEFQATVAENGAAEIHLFDGKLNLTNELGQLEINTGQGARLNPGQAPAPEAVLPMGGLSQWALYYPGVLNVDELQMAPQAAQALADSIAAYRQGDLLHALALYPAGREPATNPERIYYASLLLAVGQVQSASSLLASVDAARDERAAEFADALKRVIAATQGQVYSNLASSSLATSALAESIYQQSRSQLHSALLSAQAATRISPDFGFAWERVAELEFGFGRIGIARTALERSLTLAPKNAEALALKGFLDAATGQWSRALKSFDEAIATDGALGNAWLGRGLCRIRLGDREAGRLDLETAAILEPQRSMLRSYLGKAFAHAGDWTRADNELRLAQELDPRDPTVWLYAGLLRQQENRINEAVRDFETSKGLNENRGMFRSRMLLDQDYAMRSANLAIAYEDAGMGGWAIQEASHSVAAAPANFSSHLFLGNSFQQLRESHGVNQRFEAPAVNEYLLAGLLGPASGNLLAQSVSQQEYSKLFERDGVGISSSTEYLSNGDWLEAGSVYGSMPGFGYAASGFFRSQVGWRQNNDLQQTELSLQLKHQLTAQDSFYFRSSWGDAEGGDLLQRYDPSSADPTLRFKERQEPILLAGYHREWQPGMHTLVLGGWFKDEQRVTDLQAQTLVLGRDPGGIITDVLPVAIEQTYRNRANLFTVEAQQIWQTEQQTMIVGARAQGGSFQVDNLHTNAAFIFPFLFPNTSVTVNPSMERYSVYGYEQWRPVAPLLLVAGLSYDWLRYPNDFRYAPLSPSESRTDRVSPKGGIIWTPRESTTLRAAYSRSLGGVSLEQSFRLEPTQVAGLNQAFRSLIPESIAGANAAAPFESWSIAWQERLAKNTWLLVEGEWLKSNLRRQFGAYDFSNLVITPGATTERLNYRERSVAVTANQFVGREWSLGAQYRLSEARLGDNFPDVAATAALGGGFSPRSSTESILHRVNLFANYNHSSGFFGQAQALWFGQLNHGYGGSRPGDDFWQFNVLAGYRLWHRHAEITVGVLNVTDQDYRLNPLNLTPDLPRERSFLLAFKLNF